MRAVVNAIGSGDLEAEAAIVISNNADAEALVFARARGLVGQHISKKTAGSDAEADRSILDAFERAGVNLIVLSGYLRMVGPLTLARYREVMGATNPANAAPGTIRQLFAESFTGNSVHGSDSPENAEIEIAQFFEAADIVG